jgi:hypothetical protein
MFDLRAHQRQFAMDRRKFPADRMLNETTVELAKFREVLRSDAVHHPQEAGSKRTNREAALTIGSSEDIM